MVELDDIDKGVLREVQGNLPVVSRPFLPSAQRLGITEEEFLRRVGLLIKAGTIRKLGLRIDSARVGFASTLVALKTAPEKVEKVAGQLNAFEGVTHNYQREHGYNLWFTVIERDEAKLRETLERIEKEVEHEDMLNLPMKRRFKIDVRFEIR